MHIFIKHVHSLLLLRNECRFVLMYIIPYYIPCYINNNIVVPRVADPGLRSGISNSCYKRYAGHIRRLCRYPTLTIPL